MDAPDSGRNSLTSEVSTAPALSGKEWDGFAVLDEEIVYRSATAAQPTTIPSPSPHSPMKASEGASSDTSSATFDAAPPAPPPSLRGSAQPSSEDDEVAALSSLWREMRIQSSELSASLRMAAQGIDEIIPCSPAEMLEVWGNVIVGEGFKERIIEYESDHVCT